MNGSEKIRQDPRFRQAHREALLSLVLAGVYFLWWYATAYGFGSGPVDQYTFIAGFPTWFFFSCVASVPLFVLLSWAMVRFLFKEIPLDGTLQDDPEPREPGQ
ncbi:MAG TPA: YhdT family protein [Desulfomicrobiaceae bacterium]|nr:YhdT family protein [Desulfomicrobiaceae bacterium]